MQPGHIELLAPAGNLEALHAAVTAGADAVYLGMPSFNARRGADNFDAEALADACDYAHLRGASIFVTLNTVILPSEFEDACACAREAVAAGADALIVQDIGLASFVSNELPTVRLHISTQMNTLNRAGIRAAARLGATRVTLARELSLGEIAALAEEAASLSMEVETFAHGALCICYSGQCLLSSMIGGRSANRGMCAQACRLPYELRAGSSEDRRLVETVPTNGEFLLSPKDLATIDVLPDLIAAGVSSLKIEGRMKSADYVYAVTDVYRRALDRLASSREDASTSAATSAASREAVSIASQSVSEEDRRILDEAFSRGFTTAYLTGDRHNGMMGFERPNNRGVFIGRVQRVRDDTVSLTCNRPLVAGDVLEFWTRRGNVTATVTDPVIQEREQGRTDRAREQGRDLVTISIQDGRGRVNVGDRVFRARSATASFHDDPHEPRVPLVGEVTIRRGEPLRATFTPQLPEAPSPTEHAIMSRLSSRFPEGLPSGTAQGPLVEAARTKALAREDAISHIDRLGNEPYRLLALDVDLDEDVGLGFSALHHVRTDALDDLTRRLTQRRDASGERNGLSQIAAATAEQIPVPISAHDRPLEAASTPVRTASPFVAAWVTNPACARAAKRAGAARLYVPALCYGRGRALYAGVARPEVASAGYPKDCVVVMPIVDHDPVGTARENLVGEDLWRFAASGKPLFVESLGDLERAYEEGIPVEVGPHLPLTNACSLDLAAAWGAGMAWLSPELTLRQIHDLSEKAVLPLGITVSGAQELMVTEHCLLMSEGPCDQHCDRCPRRQRPHGLKDRKGYEFPVFTDALGRSHLMNSVPLDIVPAISDLLEAGVVGLMVDATMLDERAAGKAVSRAVDALKDALAGRPPVPKLSGTTTGHLFRGVS